MAPIGRPPVLRDAAVRYLRDRMDERDGRNDPTTTRRIAAAIYAPDPPDLSYTRRMLSAHPEIFERVRAGRDRHARWRLAAPALAALRADLAEWRAQHADLDEPMTTT